MVRRAPSPISAKRCPGKRRFWDEEEPTNRKLRRLFYGATALSLCACPAFDADDAISVSKPHHIERLSRAARAWRQLMRLEADLVAYQCIT